MHLYKYTGARELQIYCCYIFNINTITEKQINQIVYQILSGKLCNWCIFNKLNLDLVWQFVLLFCTNCVFGTVYSLSEFHYLKSPENSQKSPKNRSFKAKGYLWSNSAILGGDTAQKCRTERSYNPIVSPPLSLCSKPN